MAPENGLESRQGLILDFSQSGGRREILAYDSFLAQDVGICIVCLGVLAVFMFWFFIMHITH